MLTFVLNKNSMKLAVCCSVNKAFVSFPPDSLLCDGDGNSNKFASPSASGVSVLSRRGIGGLFNPRKEPLLLLLNKRMTRLSTGSLQFT